MARIWQAANASDRFWLWLVVEPSQASSVKSARRQRRFQIPKKARVSAQCNESQGRLGSLHRIYLWCDMIIYLTQILATWELQDKINIFQHTFRQSRLSLSVSMSSTKKASQPLPFRENVDVAEIMITKIP